MRGSFKAGISAHRFRFLAQTNALLFRALYRLARTLALPAPSTRIWRTLLLAALFLPCAQALDWQAGQGYKSAALPVPKTGRSGFRLMSAADTGITFSNRLSDRTVATNRVYENGSGVALGDVDGDGWCDIYFCRLEGPNVLYRNLGNWRFEDITASAGVECAGQFSTGAAFADVDGDGDLDLLVNAIGGGTRLFLNDGKGHFSELTGSRLVRRFGSTSLALADVDGDGDLDLYVTNYRTDTYRDRPPGLKVEATMAGGKIVVTPEGRFIPIVPQGGGVQVVELGERDFLYLNDGHGRFSPVSWTAGSFLDEDGKALAAPPLDWGLSVMLRDLNGDGLPDIYVCNDFFYSPDRIWLNDRSQRFRAISRTALREFSLASMAVDVADINRDGYDDILVVEMRSRSHLNRQRQRPEMMKGLVHPPLADPEFRPEVPRNTLFLNRGDGTYAEIAQLSNLAATEWSWGALFLDVDLDGYEDLLVATGNSHDVQDADVLQQIASIREQESPEQRLARFPGLATRNLAFRNLGNLTFQEVSADWGFDLLAVSQGMALADLDNDGDLDVVINNLNAPAALYRNESAAPRIAVRLKGMPPNLRGIGAKIKVFGGPVPLQSQEMICGGRYLSSDDTMRVFAAPSSGRARIEVHWRSGRQTVIEGAEPNRLFEIEESGPPVSPSPAPADSRPAPFFQDVSQLLGHRHMDEPFDDFARQPLLTHQLSQLGPGVGWIDIDGDGWDDLVVGSGRGGHLAIFHNDGKGSFSKREESTAGQDQTAIVAWAKSPTNSVVLVASANYEDPSSGPSAVREFGAGGSRSGEVVADLPASAGPLAMSDIDGDGALDLFVGGRVAGGRYPEPVSSRLYRNAGGKFQLDRSNPGLLDHAGLVSGAVFSDLDGDGQAELILACEWGPLRIFRNLKGHFTEVTQQWGLDRYRGWWNGVTTGDFDGDGRMDIAASNWGRNTKYQAFIGQPLRTYYGDYDGDGSLEVLEAYFDPASRKIVPWRDFETVAKALPFIRERISSFRAYGSASVPEILGPNGAKTAELEANTLDSMVFLNRGDHFEALPLPVEAQFAPAFGLVVADYDGDGREDLFLAQNFFGVEPETSRYDGGRGLWLRGNGQGGFTAIPGQVSGIQIYGEQRGCAMTDYDHDGRPDLVVAQNSGPTRLYHNIGARPGLRVRLAGPPANPNAVGAVIRLKFGERLGPAREIHAGGGYWSQDGFTQVFGIPEVAAGVWVRWPGGRETLTPIAPGVKEVRVAF